MFLMKTLVATLFTQLTIYIYTYSVYNITSHVAEHGGSNASHNISTNNMSQANINVDGSYPEESNQPDYSLFQEQGASFMPGLFSCYSALFCGLVDLRNGFL